MVDHVVGGVGGGVLLDSDLGDMVDLVVDLVANLVDNRSCGNMDGWSCNMVVGNGGHGNSRCSLDSWSSNMVVSNNRGSYGDNRGSVGNRINKSILVHIFRESLQGERGIATVGSNQVTNKRGEGVRG